MQKDLVYDVGMNNGDDTAYYLARGYRVVAVEADPTLVEDARSRFSREIAAGRLTLLNIAVGAENKTASFWICDENRVWNSFLQETASHGGTMKHHAIEVPVRRFDEVLREHGVPLYLKVDIEGYDHYCLSAIDPKDPPRFVSWEVSRPRDIFLVQDRGYNAFKCISQSTFRPMQPADRRRTVSIKGAARRAVTDSLAAVPALKPAARAVYRMVRSVPEPAGPRRNLAHNAPPVMTADYPTGPWSFPFGSSGPFGEDLPGEWKTAEEIAYEYMDFWLNAGRFGAPDWFDVHATILEGDAVPAVEWSHG